MLLFLEQMLNLIYLSMNTESSSELRLQLNSYSKYFKELFDSLHMSSITVFGAEVTRQTP